MHFALNADGNDLKDLIRDSLMLMMVRTHYTNTDP